MADSSDVATAIVQLIAATVYPNGPAKGSIGGVDARIFVGWPSPDVLKQDFSVGHSLVSVYPLPTERNTTRYTGQRWDTLTVNTPTITLTANGQVVTVGGAIPPKTNQHHVSIFVNHVPYPYMVQPSDTLASIAQALAQAIGVDVQGVFPSGNTITFPQGVNVGPCRVGITGSSIAEVKRQEKAFQVTIWSPNPQDRATLAKAIDAALAALTFIDLPNGESGRLRYTGSHDNDLDKQGQYKRTLMYTVEYGSTVIHTDPQILQIGVTVLPND